MNILITSVGNKVNLIKYFRRALFNEGGGKIYGTDSSTLINGRHFVDKFIKSPKSSDVHFNPWLKELIQNYQIDFIIPSRDSDLEALSLLRDEIHNDYACTIMVSDSQAISTCVNKDLFYRWCSEHGFRSAVRYTKAEVTPEHLPVFLKPKQGSGSRGVFKVSFWDDWLGIFEDLDDGYIIQEYINADEYTVDVYLTMGGQFVSAVPRIRSLVQQGESIHSRIDLDAEMMKLSKKLALDLGLKGHNTLQLFKMDDGLVISEVNARFGGGFTLSVEAGADSPRYLLQEKLNKAISFNAEDLVNGLELLRIQKDLFFGGKNKKVYCFDLDGTICTESCPYEDAQAVAVVVDKVNSLFHQGHEIVIASARGASSGKDWSVLIMQQLADWGVCYTRLVCGKPFADYYVDNKSIDVLEFI